MASTFLGFNIARTGLMSSQQGINITSHNMTNANTDGYSRQRIDFKAENPEVLPGQQGSRGLGVQSLPVTQIRDEFLDASFRKEASKQGEFKKRSETFLDIEGIINEPSESGITTSLNLFFQSLQELSKTPDSLTTRSLVRQRSVSMAAGINYTSAQFEKLQADLNYEVGAYVRSINGYARELADLNNQIYKSEIEGGGTANDIRDQRNIVIDKLSELVKINYYEDDKGRFNVTIQGHHLVSHKDAYELKLVQRNMKKNEVDIPDLCDIEWADGSSFTNTSGKLKATLDMRDGVSDENKGVPYYMDRLNVFIDVMSNEMNRIHQSGFDMNKETGTFFFTENNMSTAEYKAMKLGSGFNGGPAVNITESAMEGVTATMTSAERQSKIDENIKKILSNNPQFSTKNAVLIDGNYYVVDRMRASKITISKELDYDLNKFAASITAKEVPGNGENALQLASVRTNVKLYAWGSPDDFVRTWTANLGVDSQEAKRVSENQDILVKSVKFKRSSISGVSLDEETAEMLKFQHAYNANARMITTIDGMLDTLINRMGAGR